MKSTGKMLWINTSVGESSLYEHAWRKVPPYFRQSRRVVYPG